MLSIWYEWLLINKMKYGVIIRNLTDLRAKPDFRSERKSQLLYGEPVEVGQMRKGYFRVQQADGYFGWVDAKSIFLMSRNRFAIYRKKLNYIITSRTVNITNFGSESKNDFPFLFYGSKVNVIKKSVGFGIALAPDGARYKIALKNLARLSKSPPKDFSPHLIIKEAGKFLGTPYLWGGAGPYGFDCSGLVQCVYGRFGLYLPRDSKDQQKAGRKIAPDEIKCGDLLFFPGHVAIAIDKYRIIHASLGEGGVAFNSLNSKDANFRKDLSDTFLEARRVTA